MTWYPVLPLRDVVVFPGLTMPLFVKRPRTLAAIAAMTDGQVMLLAQRSGAIEAPTPADLYAVGTLARVVKQSSLADGTVQLVVAGEQRARIVGLEEADYLRADVASCGDAACALEEIGRATVGISELFQQRFGTIVLPTPDGTPRLRTLASSTDADHHVFLMQQVLELPDLSAAARLERLKQVLADQKSKSA